MPNEPETTMPASSTAAAHARHGTHREVTAPRSQFYQGAFGRLFRNLPPWTPEGDTEQKQIAAIFKLAEDSFEAGFDRARDNEDIPAGYTYFGQFIDHDLTFDPTSSLQRRNDPDHLQNFRTPRFDLDNIYGRGPDDQPYLYVQPRLREKPGRLLIGANAEIKAGDPGGPKRPEPDLPRNTDTGQEPEATDPLADFKRHRVALIGDPRNDENIIVSQLQLAVIQFHNQMMNDRHDFEEARRLTRWHYQWVVIHDFLKKVCGTSLIDDLLTQQKPGEPSLCFYHFKNKPFIPVEFSGAAYRMGHSMVRGKYELSDRLSKLRKDAGFDPLLDIFKPDALADSLQGGRMLPPFWTIQWDKFVTFKGSTPQRSRRIDFKLAPQLAKLPLLEIEEKFRSLPFRNLLRSWRLELPSGQDVARRMGIKDPVKPVNKRGDDPLWIYILNEAEKFGRQGRQLGPVGATIVGEVFVGLLAGDPSSYYATNPTWEPPSGRDFDLAAFLEMAKAPMTKEGVDGVVNP